MLHAASCGGSGEDESGIFIGLIPLAKLVARQKQQNQKDDQQVGAFFDFHGNVLQNPVFVIIHEVGK